MDASFQREPDFEPEKERTSEDFTRSSEEFTRGEITLPSRITTFPRMTVDVIGVIGLIIGAVALYWQIKESRKPKCPVCGFEEVKVLDSGESLCPNGHRWRRER